MKHIFIVFTAVFFLSCASQNTQVENPEQAAINDSQNAMKATPQPGRLGPDGTFPFVYQGEGRSNWFEAYNMRFQLKYPEELFPMDNASIPWLKPDNFSEKTGVYITYVRNGRQISLANPYIQVQYLSKYQPYCSTIDSIFSWLDDTHINRRLGEVVKDKHMTKTVDGRDAYCKTYQTPTREEEGRTYSGKQMAYAYIDYDEDYWIGIALTCGEPSDYALNIDLFYEIVSSFERI